MSFYSENYLFPKLNFKWKLLSHLEEISLFTYTIESNVHNFL